MDLKTPPPSAWKRFVKNPIPWGILGVAVIAAVLVFWAIPKFQAEQNAPVSNVAQLTESNYTQYLKPGKPLFIEVCTPDICKMQLPALEAIAAQYKDRVTFVYIDPTTSPQLYASIVQVVGQAAGGQLPEAFPMHIFLEGTELKPINFYEGLLGPMDLGGFVEMSLNPRPQVPTTPTPGTTTPGASTPSGPAATPAPSTTTP